MPMKKIQTYIKSLLLAAILTGVWGSAYSQFNDTTFFHTAFQSSGSINKTNDGTAYLLNNAFRFNVKKKDVSLNFNNNWIYGKQNGNVSNNDFSTSLDFNLYKTFPHFFYWGLANYNTSYSLKINNQLLAGAGVAYSFFDSPNTYLNISDGILFDSSDLMLANNVRDKYETYRNSLRLSFRFNIKDRIVIDGSNFLQNSMQRQSDFIIRSVTNLSFKVQKWLSLTTSLNYNRVNRTNSENLLFTYGLTAEKWF
jgi:hypothetical protein